MGRQDIREFIRAEAKFNNEIEIRRKNLARMLVHGNMAIPFFNLKTDFYRKTCIRIEFALLYERTSIIKFIRPNIQVCLDYLCPE